MELIDKLIINRSTRAIKCLSFNANFYNEIQKSGISADEVSKHQHIFLSKRTISFFSQEQIENNFLWLIKIGVLRREVDGQGLTSKVRLTPLGRLILENEPTLPNQIPSIFEHIINWMIRKLFIR